MLITVLFPLKYKVLHQQMSHTIDYYKTEKENQFLLQKSYIPFV